MEVWISLVVTASVGSDTVVVWAGAVKGTLLGGGVISRSNKPG